MLPFRWPQRFGWVPPARGYKAIMILWIGILRKHWNSTRSSSESQLAALGNMCFLWSQLNPFRPCNTPVQPSMAVTLNCQGMFTRLTLDIRGNDNFQKRTFAEIVAFPCWSIWVNLFGSHDFAPIFEPDSMASTLPQYPLQGFCLDLQQWQQMNISIIRNKTACKLRLIPQNISIDISPPQRTGWRIWNPWYLWRHQPPGHNTSCCWCGSENWRPPTKIRRFEIQWFGYGSIPINTIFRGMTIHLPGILMFTRGTRFWHTAIWVSNFETLSSL